MFPEEWRLQTRVRPAKYAQSHSFKTWSSIEVALGLFVNFNKLLLILNLKKRTIWQVFEVEG